MEKDIEKLSRVAPLSRQPLNVMVYENIKMGIVSGDLKPGTKLNEMQIAKQLNVSATPVREAFRHLQVEGLVETIPWRGTVVKEFTEKEIFEAYQCREALEVLATKLAVQQIDEEGLEKLQEQVDLSRDPGSVTDTVKINSSIHETILEYADNKRLQILLSQINDVVYHDRNISAYGIERREQIYQEHVELVNAFKARDTNRAEKAMSVHIQNGFEYIKMYKEKR
ncbi:GntR family transcriptional regulator [Virgibacillus siamensis]|uniref:GntR family transcriptional regulator n=1 Tax=Virgibacillus siamensis TaxID=480071 RepID=A0ABP3RM29_9BACI